MFQQVIITTSLYSIGIVIGFLLIPFFMKVPLDEKAGVELDKKYDELFLVYKFVDEVEEAPMSDLSSEELEGLRDKQLTYEIPYLNQIVVMYYDHEKEEFCYYAKTNLIYKYLMIVARKYVLDFKCKQIFKEIVPSMKREEKAVQFSAFVAKTSKTFLEKEMNVFHYLGQFPIEKKLLEPKNINYSDYWKMCQLIADLKTEPVSEPVSEPILEDFSSNPDNQSIETD